MRGGDLEEQESEKGEGGGCLRCRGRRRAAGMSLFGGRPISNQQEKSATFKGHFCKGTLRVARQPVAAARSAKGNNASSSSSWQRHVCIAPALSASLHWPKRAPT